MRRRLNFNLTTSVGPDSDGVGYFDETREPEGFGLAGRLLAVLALGVVLSPRALFGIVLLPTVLLGDWRVWRGVLEVDPGSFFPEAIGFFPLSLALESALCRCFRMVDPS